MSKNKPIIIYNHTEKVDEIITKVPPWILRWGNMIIIILLVGVFIIVDVIDIPTSLKVAAKLTDVVNPTLLITNSSGRLELTPLSNRSFANKGDVLAIVGDSINWRQINHLDSILNTLTNNTPMLRLVKLKKEFFSFQEVGTLSIPLNSFKTSLGKYSFTIERTTKKEFDCYSVVKSLITQISCSLSKEKKLMDSVRTIDNLRQVTKKLTTAEGVKSINGFKFKNELLLKYLPSILRKLDTLKQKSLLSSQEHDVRQAFTLLKNAIENYKEKHFITAPFSGRITYLKPKLNHELVTVGQPIIQLTPIEINIIKAEAVVSFKDSRKIKLRQVVIVKIVGYHFKEATYLKASVAGIAHLSDNNSIIYVHIPIDGLTGISKRNINSFRLGMLFPAEITISNKSLLSNFLEE